MNPAYFLAYKLGIPVIVQPEWDECQKLREEGIKLRNEIWRLSEEGLSRWNKGWKLYRKAVARELGFEQLGNIDWKTREVRLL